MSEPRCASRAFALADALARVLIALWIGGMWAVGYLAAPVLFKMLAPDRILAGAIAGQLFTYIAWIGLGTAIYLLALLFVAAGRAATRRAVFWVVAALLACVAIGYFGIQHEMAALKAGVASMDVMESAARERFT
ncbi:MAG: DUF4149 domain-containing protein, partial [Azoarcus sp.]|nr:DUF4149 domain-containing protein [Azoarcus sp.]